MLWVLHPWVKGGWKSSNNMELLMVKSWENHVFFTIKYRVFLWISPSILIYIYIYIYTFFYRYIILLTHIIYIYIYIIMYIYMYGYMCMYLFQCPDAPSIIDTCAGAAISVSTWQRGDDFTVWHGDLTGFTCLHLYFFGETISWIMVAKSAWPDMGILVFTCVHSVRQTVRVWTYTPTLWTIKHE
jgi:hypothetical protein